MIAGKWKGKRQEVVCEGGFSDLHKVEIDRKKKHHSVCVLLLFLNTILYETEGKKKSALNSDKIGLSLRWLSL